jgi:hypothetical protein
MRDPRQYNSSLILCQIVVTITGMVVGIVIYYFCDSYVASLAPCSAGKAFELDQLWFHPA